MISEQEIYKKVPDEAAKKIPWMKGFATIESNQPKRTPEGPIIE